MLRALERDLGRRFGADYEVAVENWPATALHRLERWRSEGRELALLIADERPPGMSGAELLTRAHRLHPRARRTLLVTYADLTTNDQLNRAMALGEIDGWLMRPWDPAEVSLYPLVGDLLADWARTAPGAARFEAIRVVGPRWAPRSHELRDNLERNGLPYGFYATDSEDGRRLLDEAGHAPGPGPVALMFDGRVLVDPSFSEIVAAFGMRTRPDPGRYDVAVVGSGPAGMSASVYAASEGLRTLTLEHDAIGGQAGTTSSIRNYLGFPRGVSGQRLALSAHQQATFFGAALTFCRATGLAARGDDRVLALADGGEAVARTVVIATGASYRRLGVPALEALVGSGVYYGAAVAEARAMAGQDVFVVGGGNSAGQAALHLSRYAERVTLLVRGGSLASSMSHYLVREIEIASNVEVRLRTRITGGDGADRLERLTLHDGARETTETVAAGGLFVLIGARPRTEWLADTLERDDGGYILTGRDLMAPGGPAHARPPLYAETSMPGVFAAGDARHGSTSRVASAVGEGSVAIQSVHEYLAELGERAAAAPRA